LPPARHLIAAAACVAIACLPAAAAIDAANPLTPPEQRALFLLIRQTVTPGTAGADAVRDIPERLLARTSQDVLLSLYHEGACVARAGANQDAILTSALAAAGRLKKRCDRLRRGKEFLEQGRLSLDIVIERRRFSEDDQRALHKKVSGGIDGLCVRTPERVDQFTPLVVLRRIAAPFLLQSLFTEIDRLPPDTADPQTEIEALRTLAYVETAPAGAPARVERGNVLVGKIGPDDILRHCLAAGGWILRMQEARGDFMERYDPLLQRRFPGTDYADRVHAAASLYTVFQMTAHAPFRQAADKVVGRTKTVVVEETITFKPKVRGSGLFKPKQKVFEIPIAYVRFGRYLRQPDPKNPKTGRPEPLHTAIFLQVLLRRAALTEGTPDRVLMERMGLFLTGMIARNGLVYPTMRDAVSDAPSPRVSDGTSEEAAIALCRLYRETTETKWLEAAGRILEGLVRTQGTRPDPRLVVGLAEHYLVSSDRKYANLCLEGARRLLPRQHRAGRAARPDLAGGFGRKGEPTTLETAESVEALSFACAVARDVKHEDEALAAAVLEGTRFLINQQFRPENSFYIPRPELVEGGFRQSPRSLFLRLADAQAAVRALVTAHQTGMRPGPAK